MKKILLIAAMALFTLTASAQAKFAYVDFNELVMLAPEADAARSQMQAAQKEAQETLQSMMEEAQTKYNEYQQKQSTWTPAIKSSKEKELGVFFGYYMPRKERIEPARLEALHGEEYRKYNAAVPALFFIEANGPYVPHRAPL